MGQWVGAQGRPKLTKISKTCPHCDITCRKAPAKTKNVFSMSTRRLGESEEGLNSSLAPASCDLWPKKSRPITAVKGLNTFTTQQQIFVMQEQVYWCIYNGTSDYQPPFPGSYEQSQVHNFRSLGCKEIRDFVLMQRFVQLIQKQSLYLEGNVLQTSPNTIHSGELSMAN